MTGLIAKEEFIGIEHVTHLATGGEAPVLASNQQAVNRFMLDKGLGLPGRDRMFATADRVREQLALLLGGKSDDVALLWNATAGLHAVATGLGNSEDSIKGNIVVAASEFQSVLHVWEGAGLNVRRVGANPQVTLDEISAAVTSDTQAIVVSHVSYLTGVRNDLAGLREIADKHGARLIVDASHALGVVPVDGSLCDVVVSCCYKWLLGTHGVGIFYVNSDRWPDLETKVVGWNSVVFESDWKRRETYQLKPTARKFESGNPSFMSIYYLHNALARLLEIGISRIEPYILELGGELRRQLEGLDVDLLTPETPSQRAGNISIFHTRSEALEAELRENGVLAWGGDNRLRISVHLYNDEKDIVKCVEVLRGLSL